MDLQFQRKLLNFILSPSDKKKELSQLDIKDFLQNEKNLDILTQVNGALSMLNKKLHDSELLQNQINDLSELYFISTLNNYY